MVAGETAKILAASSIERRGSNVGTVMSEVILAGCADINSTLIVSASVKCSIQNIADVCVVEAQSRRLG